MMTIKHITKSGEEFIYPSTHANFVPGLALNDPSAKDTLWWYGQDGEARPIDDGRVYVMNDHGTTVARYDMRNGVPDISSYVQKP